MKSPKLRGKKLNKQKFHAWTLAFVFGSIGFLLLSLIPAIIFTKVEGWHISESLYFTIITLTTIGFGDYVPGSLKFFDCMYFFLFWEKKLLIIFLYFEI